MAMLMPGEGEPRNGSSHHPFEREIRAELARILQEPDFQSSPRSAALLSHIVEKTLAGRHEEIKESTIGVEVYHRPPDYDTRRDAIVRSEARRLREKLNRYNLADRAVRIDVPRGSYQAEFQVKPAPAGLTRLETRSLPGRWIAASLVVTAAAILSAVSPWRRTASEPAIAILPFANHSADSSLQYLSDGLTEDLERSLSRVKGLRIHAHPPASSLPADYQALGRQLGVSALLDGSISGAAGQADIAVSLIRTSDRAILWTDRFRYQGSLAPEEHAIEEAAAAALGVKLTERQPRENSQAHDLFLRGRNLTATRRPAEEQRGIALFEQALQIDPNYALAYMGIADAYGVMAANGQIDSAVALARGMPAGLKAVELDPSMAEAHAALGMLKGVAWDGTGQEQEYRRAIELNPNYGRGYLRLGLTRFVKGDFAGAERLIREAETLDPTSLALPMIRAELYYYWRRYDESINLSRQVQQIDPDPHDAGPYLVMIRDYLQLHRTHEVETMEREIAKTQPAVVAKMTLADCRAAAGQGEEAARLMREVVDNLRAEPVDPYNLALAFAYLHDAPDTLRWLEEALRERTPDLTSARWEPALDFVRGEKRYRAVVDGELRAQQ